MNDRNGKSKTFPWPKEHGAWALLLVPYGIGAAIGGAIGLQVAAGFVSLILLLFAKRPLFLGFRSSGALSYKIWGLLFLVPGIALVYWALRALPEGIALGWLIAGAAAGLVLVLLELGRGRRDLIREIVSTPILALTAPLGFHLAGGTLPFKALILWALVSAAFIGLVLYARTMITIGGAATRFRNSRDLKLVMLACRLYHLLLIPAVLLPALAGWWPEYAAAAFIPIALQGVSVKAREGRGIKITRVGVTQTLHSVLFAILFYLTI